MAAHATGHIVRSLVRHAVLIVGLLAAGAALATPASLVERARAAMRVDPETSRQLAEQALAALAAAPDADLQLRAHLQLCDYHSERSVEDARRHIEQAQALLSTAKRPGLRAGVLICEGELHQYAGDNVQAMALFQQAVAVAESSRDEEMLAEALYQRGYLRGLQGELANGLADLRQSMALYEKLNLPQQMQTAVNSVAILYNRMGDYAYARRYFEASLRVQEAQGLTREVVVTRHNLGRVLENMEDWDAAQRAFETVLALSREIDYRRGEAYALRGLASVRNARGAHAEALALLERAARAQQATPDLRLRAQIQLQRGIALRGLKRIDAGIAELHKALQVFRQAESLAEIAATHGELARSLALAGDWRGAYEQQVKFKAATESLLRRQLDQRFATLRVEFDTESRIKENELLQRENAAVERALLQEQRATRLQGVVLALLVLLAGLLAALAWRHHRTSQQMRQLAMTDELTGLANRRHVLTRLDALLAEPGRRCALLIADVDHFKSINDHHGHLVGDEILRAVAQSLQEAARDPVLLGRLGGEEFVLVLPDADEDAAHALAQRLLAQVRALDLSRWLGARQVSISVGLTASVAGDAAGQMLRRADSALYAAKAGGRDCVVGRSARDDAAVAAAPT
jgi:diguanylate cyclase (GGDEF)-like protein